MKLKSLSLHGFKSFKDRTSVLFDAGITGIVGPNGCGKSNIVDALFWVMGEQSAKHLRGNSMKDVIFSGSQKYNPGSFAQVTLVLENEGGKPVNVFDKVVQASEIELSRKLYRSGESEYRINNQICRLKDIQEVFMDTGAGAKSYSIIAQGEIDRLVKAKPEEKRSIIEEVAGVTKFKKRRQESIRKIEQTNLNLARISDLEKEVFGRLKELKSQAEKALKAKKLKEDIKETELEYQSYQTLRRVKNLTEANTEMSDCTTVIENTLEEKNSLEALLESSRERKKQAQTDLKPIESELLEAKTKLGRLEEKLSSVDSKKIQLESILEREDQRIQSINEDISNREITLEEINEKLSVVENVEGKEEESRSIEEEIGLIDEKIQETLELVGDKRRKKEENLEAVSRLENIILNQQTIFEDSIKEIEEISARRNKLEGMLSTDLEKIRVSEKDVFKLKEEQLAIEDRLIEKLENKESLSEKLNEAQLFLKEKETKKFEVQAELKSLEKLHDSNEGRSGRVQNFLKDFSDKNLDVLIQNVEVDSKWATVTETLLGDWIDSVNSNPEIFEKNYGNKNVKGLVRWDKIEKNPISLDQVSPLSEFIKTDNAAIENFLSHFGVLKSDSSLSEKEIQEVFGKEGFWNISSSDGHLIYSLLGTKVIYGEEKDGRLERANKITSLKEEEEILVSSIKDLEELVLERSDQRERSIEEISEMNSRKSEILSTIHQQETEIKFIKERLGSVEIDISRFKTKISNLSTGRFSAEEEIVSSKKLLEEHKVVSLNGFSEIESLEAREKELQENRLEKKERLIQIKSDLSNFEERLSNLEKQKEDYKSLIENLLDKRKESFDIKEETLESLQEMGVEEAEAKEEIKTLGEKVIELENQAELFKSEITEIETSTFDQEKKAKSLSLDISKNEKRINELALKIEKNKQNEVTTTIDIVEKYQVNLRDICIKHLEIENFEEEGIFESIEHVLYQESEEGQVKLELFEFEIPELTSEQIKRRGERYKRLKREFQQLGAINWDSVDEYEHIEKRHNFIKEQEDELRVSLSDLNEAILKIDEKCKVRFKEAFKIIDERFKRVFPIIFGGGSAYLKLVGSFEDPLCGVEIVAQPPGKKMQSLNLLSGGEKAMTALSLIFSIFLVKPSPFCLLDEVDAPLDDANVGKFNDLLREMSTESQFILITHNKKTMEMNDTLYGVTMEEPGISKAVSVRLQ